MFAALVEPVRRSFPSPPSSMSIWPLRLVRLSLPASPNTWAHTAVLLSHADCVGPSMASLPPPPCTRTETVESLSPLKSIVSLPAPPVATTDVTPVKSWAALVSP